jgi:hypothetical protein
MGTGRRHNRSTLSWDHQTARRASCFAEPAASATKTASEVPRPATPPRVLKHPFPAAAAFNPCSSFARRSVGSAPPLAALCSLFPGAGRRRANFRFWPGFGAPKPAPRRRAQETRRAGSWPPQGFGPARPGRHCIRSPRPGRALFRAARRYPGNWPGSWPKPLGAFPGPI